MKIETGIPMPKAKHQNNQAYPFADMQIGQSVFFPGEDHDDRAASAARKWGQRHDAKFACRRQDGGMRIWRIS